MAGPGADVILDEGREVKGRMVRASQAFTRPSNTTAYAAKDAVADGTSSPTILTFANLARKVGRGGYITGIQIFTDDDTVTEVFRLHLFSSSPTAINDNAAMTAPLYADVSKYVCNIKLAAMASQNSAGAAQTQQGTTMEPPVAIPYICGSSETSLYGMLEAVSGFTPTSGQKFTVILIAEVN